MKTNSQSDHDAPVTLDAYGQPEAWMNQPELPELAKAEEELFDAE
ncbi:hypothetical protein [Sporolactobacillus shoreicorticis]|uniref:Uncharacterized protein n=1 Tax=Sporolactobacillus shoreicorticis TaxID=1923877 RepID=A0ABW5S8E9_9BACL|nr:hypothetical protein [Sporolactobacillus shoreicorticis]